MAWECKPFWWENEFWDQPIQTRHITFGTEEQFMLTWDILKGKCPKSEQSIFKWGLQINLIVFLQVYHLVDVCPWYATENARTSKSNDPKFIIEFRRTFLLHDEWR